MKQTSRGLAPSLNTGHSTFTGARQRLAVALVAIVIAFAGAQTARAQTLCYVKFDISSGGTVKIQREEQWLEVTNGQTRPCLIPSVSNLIITPETGYVVSSITCDAPDGLSIDLFQYDDFHWSLNIHPYEGSKTPTITVHIVFNKVGGADEASAVALTADDDFHLAGGWYKVESDLALGHTVNLHGDTHIIIASGATLTVSTSDEYGISGSALTVSGEGTLNVSANQSAISVDNYTQMGCAVTLSGNNFGLNAENNVSISGGSLTTSGAYYGISTVNEAITISGGTVSSSGDNTGMYAARAMNITGGTVSASGDDYGIRGYSVSITGGQVTVSSGGIMSIFGDITLGWTSATDYITASGYVLQKDGKHVKIADGQTLYGGGFPSAYYTGTVDDPSALNGLMLRPTAAVTESGTNEYTIRYADGWDAFCAALQDNDTYNRFSGKTVKLADDITVSRMAGESQHEFCGTFDGQGKTLTVSYSGSSYVAPFSYVDGATIQNLVVEGTISSSGTRAAGVIGETGSPGTTGKSYITNCVSSVTISGDRYTGGFSIGGNVAIEGCVFNGKINATSRSGGFIGHSNSAQVIKNSLFAPKDGSSISGGTFYYNGGGDVAPVNSYYTRALGTAQGKALHSVTAGDDVTLALSGTATEYTVSGITAYEGNQGIKYGTTYYAGSGDAVSLTLSNTATGAPEGYKYGYTASAGTLIGSTLTMPAEDVTISVNTAVLTAIPWDGDGTEGSPYIIKYASQLDLLAYRVNGTHGETRREDGYENKFFQLAKDISYTHTSDWDAFDSDESNFEAIGGYYDDDDRSFSGHFDGNNKTISGIRIHKDGIGNANMFQGIFGLTGSGADIHDLTLANARITGYDYTGGIVGYNDGATVTHCHVAGDVAVCAVQSYAHYHGGIAGNNDGTIEQCTSAANLTIAGATSAYYGGIAGINYGTLSDNLAIGATVPAAAYNTYGAITGSNGGTLQRNYYANCKVANTENATGVGCGDISDGNGGYIVADVNNDNNPDGAVSINTLALTANLAPDGIYWTTYYNGALGFTIDDDEHACAYTATYSGSQLTLHKLGELGKEIPAGTAVIIVADNDVVSMTAATDLDDISISGTNDLHGVDYDTPVADIRNDLGDGTFYVLGMTTVGDEQHFGFHRYTGEEMAAHKAFVHVAGSPEATARSLTMVFDEATGIQGLTPDAAPKAQAAEHWFTLDGRRLQAKPTAPGIYVNNGKKVVIK